MKKLHIISLGCSKNLVDSEVMLGKLQDYTITTSIEDADVIIINTCGFIEAAKKESLSHIFEALELRKNGALLVASGCLVARYAKEIKEMIPEIDILTGVNDYDKIDSMIANKQGIIHNKVYLNDNEKRIITGSHIHAYIKISEGCNQSCSFCAIPHFKGKLQSRNIDSILRETESLAGLLKLINAIEAQGALISARFLYLYPSSTSFDLLDSIAESKIFQNYYDMPIQHISQTVLQDMRRNHRDVKQLLSYMKNIPNSFIRSSIIVGYPTEKDKDFDELCEFLEEFKFDRLNVFEYSKEEGTKAATLQELPRNIRTKRIRTIQAIIAKNQYELLQSLVDSTIECIIEGKSEISPYFYSARDKRWAKEIDGEILINDGDYSGIGYYNVAITECRDNILVGRIVDAV